MVAIAGVGAVALIRSLECPAGGSGRPDPIPDGREVYDVRGIGGIPARGLSADIDPAMPVLDPGRAHATGCSAATGIPDEEGLMRNRFAERISIMPDRKRRVRAVPMRMDPSGARSPAVGS